MNNKTQQRFDRSIKQAAGNQRRANDKITKARWAREDAKINREIPETMPYIVGPKGQELDDFIAQLVAEDKAKGFNP